jgi:anti-sigma-K factor RskA
MNDSLSSEELKQLIAGYVLGDLSPEEAEQIRQLIGKNPAIDAEIQALQEILSLIPYSLPETEPSNSLRSKIVTAAAQNHTSPVTISRRALPWQKIVTAIAASCAILLAFNNYYLRQQLRLAQEDKTKIVAALSKPESRITELAGTSDATSASAKIIYNPNQTKAFLVVNNLPETKREEVYRLWAIVGQDKIACADFRTDASGSSVNEVLFPKNICAATTSTMAITRESFPAPDQPLGSMVLLEKS